MQSSTAHAEKDAQLEEIKWSVTE